MFLKRLPVFALFWLIMITPAMALNDRDLMGLWKAHLHFGPALHGTLIIVKTTGGWTADFAGHHWPLVLKKRHLTLSLPDHGGSFAVQQLTDGTLSGHWVQGPSAEYARTFATPLVLHPDGKNRWRGEVDPIPDECTFYLNIYEKRDGKTGVFLRNPERNLGWEYGIDRLRINGATVTLSGFAWGQSDSPVVLQGTYNAADRVLSIYIPEHHATYDFQRDGAASSAFYPRSRRGERYEYRQPLAHNDGWSTATLSDVDVDRAAIERFVQSVIDQPIDSVHAPEVEAILLARHGKLVLEEYFHGFDRDTLHDTRSAGKSVTAVVVGAAMESGAPLSLNSAVYRVMNGGRFPSPLGSWKRAMTLRDLLTMRSGLYCNDSDAAAPGNEDTMQAQSAEPDYYRYALRVPMAYRPDTTSMYCSTNPNLALGMVGEASGESPLDVFDRLVARPLNIKRYGWPLDGVDHPYGGGGVRLLPRDFLKLAQLMLQQGRWRGQQILDPEYVRQATAPLHSLNMIQYGYLWWSIEFPYKTKSVRAFFAGGNGGQGIFAIPELDLTFAIFGGNYGDHVGLEVQENLLPNFVLPAVRERGDNPNAPVVARNFATPYAHPPVVRPKILQN